jgi:predicted ATPase
MDPFLKLKLKELRLRNYRAFSNTRLLFDDVTFLVGRNAAGKSTLLDALQFMSECLTDSLSTALERRGNLEGIMRRQKKNAPGHDVSLAASFEIVTNDLLHKGLMGGGLLLYGFRLGMGASKTNFVVKQEFFRRSDFSSSSFGREETSFHTKHPGLKPVLDPESLILPLIAQAETSWFLILDALRKISVHRFSPQALRDEPAIGSEERLSLDGGNAGDVLRRTKEADQAWIDQRLAAAVAGIRSVRATARVGRRVIIFEQEGEEGKTQRYDASMMSDGTVRSLGILLSLRQSPRPSAVLIDEIEDSLHPFAQGVILDAIESSSQDFPVVVSTHNPEILSHPSARADRIRVIQWENGASQTFHLSESVKQDLKPPQTVGRLLRSNALWTADEPSISGPEADFFKI